LSCGRKPGGRFSHKKVTSVPPGTSSNVTTSVISPKKAGSVVTKLTASAQRRQLHEPPVDHVLTVGGLAAEGAFDKLPGTIDALIAAVRPGELDAKIAPAKKKSKSA
jgi:hypothetical protein